MSKGTTTTTKKTHTHTHTHTSKTLRTRPHTQFTITNLYRTHLYTITFNRGYWGIPILTTGTFGRAPVSLLIPRLLLCRVALAGSFTPIMFHGVISKVTNAIPIG